MKFNDELNRYIELIGISAKELSIRSNIDSSTLSRYRNGKRLPSIDSEILCILSQTIEEIAKEKHIDLHSNVYDTFKKSLFEELEKPKLFSSKFSKIVDHFNINIKKLSIELNYDVSYLYRIKNGERKPLNLDEFMSSIIEYIIVNTDENKLREYIHSNGEIKIDLYRWFMSEGTNVESDQMMPFLTKLDDFDLDDYMKVIHFNELKVPKLPFQLPTSKYYEGVIHMRQAELDFFKYTVLNKSNEDVFMYSTMPMVEMAEDMEFNKKWMFGIAMSIKKGLHLNIIHHLDRPFEELMLGLEAWIPIYMTGQVSPYYMQNDHTEVFRSINYTSGSIMLSGECIDGYYEKGRYYVSTNSKEVKYAKQKTNHLLKKAKPLMRIYDSNTKDIYFKDRDLLLSNNKVRHEIYASLPLYTLKEETLVKILKSNHVSDDEYEMIINYYHQIKDIHERLIKSGTHFTLEYSLVSIEEYKEHPMYLDISGLFLNKVIPYSFDQMIDHYHSTMAYASDNYQIIHNSKYAFRNININVINEDKVIISKIKSPTIKFVIEHPTLVNAINNMITIKPE